MTSPFSPLRNYEVKDSSIAHRHHSFRIAQLNPFDQKVAKFIRNNRAAAVFQLADTKKETNKIKKLAGCRILCMYNLVGDVKMNVVSWNPMELDELLRSCALTHYVLLSGNAQAGKSIFIDGTEHAVFVPRGNEPLDILTANVYPNVLIISDSSRKELGDLTTNAKIYLDEDLCDNVLKEYSPEDFQ